MSHGVCQGVSRGGDPSPRLSRRSHLARIFDATFHRCYDRRMDLTKPPGALALRNAPIPPEAQELIERAVMATGRPLSAAEALGYSPAAYALTVKGDAEFAMRIEAATKRNVERLEEAADKRAVDGWLEPVYQKGRRVGVVRKFSDTLLIKRLEAEDRRKYGTKHAEVDVKVTAGVLVVPMSAPTSQAWADAFGAAAVSAGAADNSSEGPLEVETTAESIEGPQQSE